MKKLFLMLSLAATAMFAVAQNAPAAEPNVAEIKWESITIDYGTVTKGDESKANRVFKFTNVGKAPLVITNCNGSCGCTVPTCPKEAILPGQGGEIQVRYDINRVGPFTKTVTVTSNAKKPNETLKIQGTVSDPAAGQTPASPTATPASDGHNHPH